MNERAIEAGRNERLLRWATDLDHTERPAGGEEDISAMIREVVAENVRLAALAAAQRVAGEDERTLRHAFRNVDDLDWRHLYRFIPYSGHGQFWMAVFDEARAALAKDMDELCAACGEPRREHVTPGGTRYGPTTLCGVFIPRDRVSPGKVEGWRG